MRAALILAVVLAAPIPPLAVGAIATVTLMPLPVAAAVAAALTVAAVRRGHDDVGTEGIYLHAVAAELRAGATLRTALIEAADRVPSLDLDGWLRRARAGIHLRELAAQLGEQLPVNRRPVAAALDALAGSGGSAADVFTRLAAQADDARALERERRIAGAQARLSAVVVVLLPAPVLGWLMARGSLAALSASGPGRAVLVAGVALEVAGVATVAVMLRRNRS